MRKIKLVSYNKNKAVVMTFMIVIFTLITIIIPSLFVKYIPQSIVGTYLSGNTDFIFISIPILVYFIYTGVFIHFIRIDPYIINISSCRSISSIFFRKNYIDISHLMLIEYAFFNRPFTFNRTLMIKLKSDSEKIVAKRFTLSLLGSKEQNRICKTLDKIISNNSQWERKK